MDFGILLPTTSRGKGLLSFQEILAFAKAAEDQGFHSLWAFDHIAFPHQILEPLTVLAGAAAATRRIRLGTSILIGPARSPLVLAKSLSTLDFLSNGRLTIGLGIGGGQEQPEAWGTKSYRERRERLHEVTEILKVLWTDRRASYDGKYYHFHDVTMEPKPIQKPHPPIWLGGSISKAFDFLQGADGYVAAFTSPPRFVAARTKIMKVLSPRPGFAFANVVFSHVAANSDRAWAEADPFLSKMFRHEEAELDTFNAVGGPESFQETLHKHEAAGVDVLILAPIVCTKDQLKKIKQLTKTVETLNSKKAPTSLDSSV